MRRQGYTIYTIAAKFGVSAAAVSKAMTAMEQELYEVLAKQAAPMKASQTAMLEVNLERAILEWERSRQNADAERVVEKSYGAPATSEEPQPQGGRLKRKRKSPLDIEAGVRADSEQAGGNWDIVDPESIPGYFYNEDTGEETLPEERAGIMATWLMKQMRQGAEGAQHAGTVFERVVTNTSTGRLGDPRFLAEIRNCLADIRKIWGLDAPVKQELTGKDGGSINLVFTDSLKRVYGEVEE